MELDMPRLLKSVRDHEGYRDQVYLDSLSKRTVGVGHLCVEEFWEDDKKYSEKFLMEILEKDLENAISGAEELLKECNLPSLANEIVVEMVFQLGKTGVSKFRNFLAALQGDSPQWLKASEEMLDSRWAKQTPNRAKGMSEVIASLA
jgi:lysozyme|tara:strand:+ start:491 stop:931 length:441 start_codon:yes stop_codon:yes gene_type:complete